MIEIDKSELKKDLEKRINRQVTNDEWINAEKDPLILLEQVFKRLAILETKIKKNGII